MKNQINEELGETIIENTDDTPFCIWSWSIDKSKTIMFQSMTICYDILNLITYCPKICSQTEI